MYQFVSALFRPKDHNLHSVCVVKKSTNYRHSKYYRDFQKFGFAASLLWKVLYQSLSVEEGMYVSPGASGDCLGSTANELA